MSKEKPLYNEIIFTEEQEQQIIDMYLNQDTSSVKIGRYFGCSHKPILKVLERHNIPRTRVGIRKYKLNEEYFDNIDTPNKAYILGFLYADGNNCPTKQTIRIGLQEEDKQILEDMRKEIGVEKELVYLDNSNKHTFGYTYKNMWILNMYSKHMCQSLEKLGMIPNKSLKVTFPDIDADLYSHFIRGIFDGDGCIYNSNGKTRHLCSIVGTYDLCNHLKQFFETMDIQSHVREASNHNGITTVFEIWKKDSVMKFLNYIYQDAEMFLDRKYQRYLNCVEQYDKTT